jgi:hypothetical protein
MTAQFQGTLDICTPRDKYRLAGMVFQLMPGLRQRFLGQFSTQWSTPKLSTLKLNIMAL